MSQETPKQSDVCRLTTPEYLQTLRGNCCIYTAKGKLSLTPESLTFDSKKVSISIPLAAITDIRIGRFSRWLSPLTAKLIAVSFQDESSEKTVLLVPTSKHAFVPTSKHAWVTTVWNTNKIVELWCESLITSCPTASQQRTAATCLYGLSPFDILKRHWLVILVVAALCVTNLVTLGFLLKAHTWDLPGLRSELRFQAMSAGDAMATVDFQNGRLRVLRVVSSGSSQSTGERDGPFEIWGWGYVEGLPGSKEAAESFVSMYNDKMHVLYDKREQSHGSDD